MTFTASYLGKTVDEMLLDAGQAQSAELRAALLSLGSLASLPVPAPNTQLAALMAGPHELVRQRWLRKHRATVVSLAVVAGMGLGVSGVAASAAGQGRQASMSVQHMLEDWAPSWTIAGGGPSAGAGLLPDPQPTTPQEPAAAVQPVPARPDQPITAVPDQSVAEAGGTAKKDDGGAAAEDPASAAGTAAESRDAAGSPRMAQEAASGTEAQSWKATEARAAHEAAAGMPEDGAEELAKVQNQPRRNVSASVETTLKSAIPGTAAKNKAGKGHPGANWLKKFSR